LTPALRQAFSYADAQVDDARLVLLNALDAARRGARVHVRSRCIELRPVLGRWQATLEATDGRQQTVIAQAVANAAGPWAGGLLERMQARDGGPALRLVQGSHIVLRRPWPDDSACLLQQPDGRVVFLLPFAHDHLLVGTTDTDYRGDPARCSVLPSEVAYLCEAANHYLREPITPQDVVWQFAGVRPLLADPDPRAAKLSRDYRLQLQSSPAPALHVLGGKLTTYRVLAEEALDLLRPALPQMGPAWTASGHPLPGSDWGDATQACSRLQALAPWLPAEIARRWAGAYGSRTRRTYSALGDAVNLSARLMAAAGPGQTLVDRRVFAAAGHAFTWQDLPAILVKGKREPVTVAGLIASTERAARRLLEPRYALPMVGRQAELALAGQKLEQARQGKGQIVGITAEAGMGKSRLAAEVIRRALEQGLVGYGGECQSYGTTTSYLVWRSIWRGIYGLDPTAPPAEQVRDLEARLRAIDPRLLPRLPLLGAVLSLSIPDNDLTRSLEAKVRKSSLEALLVDCLRAKAGDHPLLLVLEDCHWLDPLSGDLIEAIGRGTADLPVLLLLVYRPPEAHDVSWARLCKLPHFTEIVLAEFTPQEAERLIQLKLEQFFGCEADVPPAFVARIAERAQGNPFYIEELLNYLQDRGIHPRDEEALAQVDLPASLYSLILTRMDQLTETQQTTLKVASVIGRLFQPAMLWGVYPQLGSLDRVRADLQALYGLDLTLLDTPEPELTYLFKHIISQEVAYESLLYATRAMLHEQIGAFIERTYPDTLEQYLNLLAFHYEHSENEPKKRAYLLRAGEAAQADYGNEAAIEYYRKVLPLLPAEERIGTQLKLGQVLELTGQWQEAEERYADALALTRQLGDRLSQAWCETAIAELFRKRGQYEQASAWLERARVGFEELGDAKGRGQVLHYGGTLAAQQGQYETARALYEDSLAIRRSLGDRSSMASLLSNLGIVARFEGNYPLARSLHEEALAIRRDLGDRWAIGVSLNNLGNVALDQGNYAEARSLHEEGLSIRRQVGDRWAIANALNNLANLTCAQGDFAAAQDLYHESLSINRELGDKWALAYLLEDIGSLAAAKDQPGQALTLTAAAATIREEIGAPLSPAEQGKLDRALEPACQVLGEMEQAIEDALQGLGKPPD